MNLFGNILKTMAVLALFQVLQGCYKDKGNYEYHDANALSINLTAPILTISRAGRPSRSTRN